MSKLKLINVRFGMDGLQCCRVSNDPRKDQWYKKASRILEHRSDFRLAHCFNQKKPATVAGFFASIAYKPYFY